jgi:hypothetical protein
MSNFEAILEFYDNKELIGFINYSKIPSMAGRFRLNIKKLCYTDNIYIN